MKKKPPEATICSKEVEEKEHLMALEYGSVLMENSTQRVLNKLQIQQTYYPAIFLLTSILRI